MSWASINPRYRELAGEVLTRRQREVLRLRLDGHSSRSIASHMHITEATVRGHYDRALEKMAEAIRKDRVDA